MSQKLNIYKQLEKDINLQKDEENFIRERLKNAPMEYDAKYPIILPKNSKFTELVVRHYYKLVFQIGVREALNQIRTKFWITKPRNYIRRIIKKCVICNRHEGNPFQYPAPPDFPSYRLSDKFAFTCSAVDYAFHCTSIMFMVNYKHLNAGSFYLRVLPLDVYT